MSLGVDLRTGKDFHAFWAMKPGREDGIHEFLTGWTGQLGVHPARSCPTEFAKTWEYYNFRQQGWTT